MQGARHAPREVPGVQQQEFFSAVDGLPRDAVGFQEGDLLPAVVLVQEFIEGHAAREKFDPFPGGRARRGGAQGVIENVRVPAHDQHGMIRVIPADRVHHFVDPRQEGFRFLESYGVQVSRVVVLPEGLPFTGTDFCIGQLRDRQGVGTVFPIPHQVADAIDGLPIRPGSGFLPPGRPAPRRPQLQPRPPRDAPGQNEVVQGVRDTREHITEQAAGHRARGRGSADQQHGRGQPQGRAEEDRGDGEGAEHGPQPFQGRPALVGVRRQKRDGEDGNQAGQDGRSGDGQGLDQDVGPDPEDELLAGNSGQPARQPGREVLLRRQPGAGPPYPVVRAVDSVEQIAGLDLQVPGCPFPLKLIFGQDGEGVVQIGLGIAFPRTPMGGTLFVDIQQTQQEDGPVHVERECGPVVQCHIGPVSINLDGYAGTHLGLLVQPGQPEIRFIFDKSRSVRGEFHAHFSDLAFLGWGGGQDIVQGVPQFVVFHGTHPAFENLAFPHALEFGFGQTVDQGQRPLVAGEERQVPVVSARFSLPENGDGRGGGFVIGGGIGFARDHTVVNRLYGQQSGIRQKQALPDAPQQVLAKNARDGQTTNLAHVVNIQHLLAHFAVVGHAVDVERAYGQRPRVIVADHEVVAAGMQTAVDPVQGFMGRGGLVLGRRLDKIQETLRILGTNAESGEQAPGFAQPAGTQPGGGLLRHDLRHFRQRVFHQAAGRRQSRSVSFCGPEYFVGPLVDDVGANFNKVHDDGRNQDQGKQNDSQGRHCRQHSAQSQDDRHADDDCQQGQQAAGAGHGVEQRAQARAPLGLLGDGPRHEEEIQQVGGQVHGAVGAGAADNGRGVHAQAPEDAVHGPPRALFVGHDVPGRQGLRQAGDGIHHDLALWIVGADHFARVVGPGAAVAGGQYALDAAQARGIDQEQGQGQDRKRRPGQRQQHEHRRPHEADHRPLVRQRQQLQARGRDQSRVGPTLRPRRSLCRLGHEPGGLLAGEPPHLQEFVGDDGRQRLVGRLEEDIVGYVDDVPAFDPVDEHPQVVQVDVRYQVLPFNIRRTQQDLDGYGGGTQLPGAGQFRVPRLNAPEDIFGLPADRATASGRVGLEGPRLHALLQQQCPEGVLGVACRAHDGFRHLGTAPDSVNRGPGAGQGPLQECHALLPQQRGQYSTLGAFDLLG